jgi:hypothetical protein
LLVFLLALVGLSEGIEAATLAPDFALYTRFAWTNDAGHVFPANAGFHLSDLAGHVAVFEFFDPTCADCSTAASYSVLGIGNWYEARKGNSNGIPVVHVHVNITPQYFLQDQVDAFVHEWGIEICANDYNFSSKLGTVETNAVHDLYFEPFFRPAATIINCVSNSPSHAQWAVLLNVSNSTDWAASILQWRAIIDSVQAPPPQLTGVSRAGGVFQFTFPGQRGRTNRVEVTSDLHTWSGVTNVYGTNAPITFREASPAAPGSRFYRVRRL